MRIRYGRRYRCRINARLGLIMLAKIGLTTLHVSWVKARPRRQVGEAS